MSLGIVMCCVDVLVINVDNVLHTHWRWVEIHVLLFRGPLLCAIAVWFVVQKRTCELVKYPL